MIELRSKSVCLVGVARLFLVFALMLFSFNSFSQNKKELENKKKKLQSDIKLTKELLEETKKDKKQSLNQLVTLNKKINIHEELISTINTEVGIIDRQIEENIAVVNSLQKDLKVLKEEYAKMIQYAYKNRNAYDKLMLVFASKDFNQGYNRLKYMQQYSEYRQKQGKQIEATQKLVNEKIAELRASKGEKVVLVQEQKTEVTQLATEKQEKETSLVELQKKEKQLKEQLKKKQEDASKLQAAIQAIIEEEIRKAKEAAIKEAAKKAAEARAKELAAKAKKGSEKGGSTTAKESVKEPVKENKTTSDGLVLTPEAQLISSTFNANKAKLPWPVAEGVIVSTYGEHEHPVLKNVKTKNNGIDISSRRGASARVIFDGEVTGVINIPNWGNAIIVRHGEYLTVYGNLSDVFVKKGDKLKTKQLIGNIDDNEDNKTQIHFEIWKGSVTLDPELWIYKNN